MNELVFKNVNKHYKNIHALKNFSFSFKNGVYGLIGPNGAGKSTLLNMISSNLSPDKDGGKIYWNNTSIDKLGKDYRKIIGFMPQQQELYSNMTAFDFLGYISVLKNINRRQIKSEISRVLESVELSELSEKKIGEFSGGMKQRLLIAQAILGNPAIIIMDEPTANLDTHAQTKVLEGIKNLSKVKGHKPTVVFASNVPAEIASANRILLLEKGQIVEDGNPKKLMKWKKVIKLIFIIYFKYIYL